MNNYIVYMHINKVNGKRYIGITSQPSEKIRWKRGSGYAKQKRFYSAIKCYGWDNFEHLVLERGLSKEQAEKREAELIAEYKSNDLNHGYNIENGGVIRKLSDEQKEHLRKINTGKKHSEETKKRMSEAQKKVNHSWLYGQKQSQETIAKRFANMSGSNNPNARTVYQYDLNGKLIAKYNCMQDAVKSLGILNSSHISRCCNGVRNKAHGYMWSYVLEEKEPYARLWKGGIVHG